MAKKAFQLRKATAADFPTFKKFHIDYDCDWLMFGFEILASNDNEESDDDFLNTFEDYFFTNFNLEYFYQYLEWYRIFMIDSTITGETIGYIQLENYCGKQIIRRWQMHPEHREADLLSTILAEAEKKRTAKCKGLQVIAISDDAESFLTKHGYHARIKPFFEKTVKKEKTD